jgi:RNA polymerase sigma-70 factor (ECF subfamily)
MSFSDEELVQRVQNGDGSAFDTLVERYQDSAFRIAQGMVRNQDDAKDLSQEAFVKAYEGIGRFKKKAAFFTWFSRILINLCIDHQRWKNRWFFWRPSPFQEGECPPHAVAEEMIHPNSPMDPGRHLEQQELKEKIKACIDSLPTMQRMVFILKHYQEMPISDISMVLNVAEGTVKSHLFRGAQHLRRQLKDFVTGEK